MPVLTQTPPTIWLAVDHTDPVAELGRHDGGLLATGAGPDHGQVEVVGVLHVRKLPEVRHTSVTAATSASHRSSVDEITSQSDSFRRRSAPMAVSAVTWSATSVRHRRRRYVP